MADDNLFKEKKVKKGFEEGAPNVRTKGMTINEAITALQEIQHSIAGINEKDLRNAEAINMAIEALFNETISAERFKHFATKYGLYKEDNDE